MLMNAPVPGSAEERRLFAALQQRLPVMFERIFDYPQAPRTVVVIPSLSLDQEVLAKVSGIHYYEERLLCLLMLLQMPRTRLIYVTSQAIHPAIIDYYLSLLPGIPSEHARRRLTLLNCHDASPKSLTRKVLERPRLVRRIRNAIRDPASAHMTCFNSTPLERTLAVRLNIPLYACDPARADLGSKSNSRKLFRSAGVDLPPGMEDLRDVADIAEALATLKHQDPKLRRAVIKLNEGFSGEGNALFHYDGAPADDSLAAWVSRELPLRLRFEAADESWERYKAKFEQMGGIVEAFIDVAAKRSPSVQCRINPLGEVCILSTHDQLLGGPSGQIFLGCTFPADARYRLEIQDAGARIGALLRDRGALGRFSVDFVSAPTEAGWRHYAIEINLRKGGTTHPYLMLEFLTGGAYNPETGLFTTPMDRPRYYYATDNLHRERYRGLTPDDLIDIAVYHGLHFNSAHQEGVVFHLLGALSEFGKLGVLSIGESPERARQLYDEAVQRLDEEAARARFDATGMSLSIP